MDRPLSIFGQTIINIWIDHYQYLDSPLSIIGQTIINIWDNPLSCINIGGFYNQYWGGLLSIMLLLLGQSIINQRAVFMINVGAVALWSKSGSFENLCHSIYVILKTCIWVTIIKTWSCFYLEKKIIHIFVWHLYIMYTMLYQYIVLYSVLHKHYRLMNAWISGNPHSMLMYYALFRINSCGR